MAFKIGRLALLSLTLVAIASAVSIPAGQPDGVYIVSTTSSGEEIHTLLPPSSSIPAPPTNTTLTSRAGVDFPSGTRVVCENAYLWAEDFYQRVYQNFNNLCWNTHRFYKEKSIYYVAGQAVAYICNYDDWDGSVCQTNEFDEFVRWAGECKGGSGGWKQAAYIDFRGQWLKSYGFTHSANNFCGGGKD